MDCKETHHCCLWHENILKSNENIITKTTYYVKVSFYQNVSKYIFVTILCTLNNCVTSYKSFEEDKQATNNISENNLRQGRREEQTGRCR
jgi:hypothetical protein